MLVDIACWPCLVQVIRVDALAQIGEKDAADHVQGVCGVEEVVSSTLGTSTHYQRPQNLRRRLGYLWRC